MPDVRLRPVTGQSLSRSVNDVFDDLRDFLREWDICTPRVAVSDAPGMMASQVARFGDAEKPADMGVAVASKIVSGLTPTISSMVRSMETVEWKVEATVGGCE